MDTGELSRLENGRITSPGLEKVMRYAAYLGFTPNEIAAEYGLWMLPDEGRLAELFRRLEVLGEGKRVRILDVLESMIDGAIHEERRRY